MAAENHYSTSASNTELKPLFSEPTTFSADGIPADESASAAGDSVGADSKTPLLTQEIPFCDSDNDTV